VVAAVGNGNNLFEPLAIVSADFNKDGVADLVVVQLNAAIIVLKGAGDGTFQSEFSFNFDFVIPYAAVIGDFNHYGNLDFAVVGSGYPASSTGGIAVVLGNGDGTFQPPIQFAVPLGALALATGDFNGDGNPDLAIVISQTGPDVGRAKVSESVEILLGDGSGHYNTGASYPAGPYVNSVAVGDFKRRRETRPRDHQQGQLRAKPGGRHSHVGGRQGRWDVCQSGAATDRRRIRA
jgi:hypothetical protein